MHGHNENNIIHGNKVSIKCLHKRNGCCRMMSRSIPPLHLLLFVFFFFCRTFLYYFLFQCFVVACFFVYGACRFCICAATRRVDVMVVATNEVHKLIAHRYLPQMRDTRYGDGANADNISDKIDNKHMENKSSKNNWQ